MQFLLVIKLPFKVLILNHLLLVVGCGEESVGISASE